jgi:hypothetical protein
MGYANRRQATSGTTDQRCFAPAVQIIPGLRQIVLKYVEDVSF